MNAREEAIAVMARADFEGARLITAQIQWARGEPDPILTWEEAKGITVEGDMSLQEDFLRRASEWLDALLASGLVLLIEHGDR